MFSSELTRFSSVRAIAEETGSTPAPNHAFGVDVSHWSGKIDWQLLAKSGVTFAFVKASEGIHWNDKNFHENIVGADKFGILCGAFHLFDPGEDGIQQALHFCHLVKSQNLHLPFVLDLEGRTITQNPDKATYGPHALKWLQTVYDNFDQTPMIYASPSTWKTYLSSEFAKYPYWQAEYAKQTTRPAGAPDWTFWQYSQKGTLSGIDGHVDFDRYNGSVTDLKARYGASLVTSSVDQ